ncbi:MAG: lipoxygenase family protein [Myxococcota bacterium]
MDPYLPNDDPDLEERRSRLERARETHTYSYEYPPGIPMLDDLSLRDFFGPSYLARVAKLDGTIIANHAAMNVANAIDEAEHQEQHDQSHSFFGSVSSAEITTDIKKRLFGIGLTLAGRHPDTHVSSLEEYDELSQVVRPSAYTAFYKDRAAQADEAFAWARLAGPNPMALEACSALPDHFPVTEEHFRRAAAKLGVGQGDSLEAALEQGRVFITDYRRVDGLPRGMWGTNGEHDKYLSAPLALFFVPNGPFEEDGRKAALLPIAIQCSQTPGAASPVFTPADGYRWTMAKTIVQTSDGNQHQMIEHLGYCHMVIEAVMLATHRQLGDAHPLKLLLVPHFEYTFELNNVAKHDLVAPGGQVEAVLGCTLDGAFELLARGMKEHRLSQWQPRHRLQQRGVDVSSALATYPYRDDVLPVWDAVAQMVDDYVPLYYGSDHDVGADPELQAWIQEMGAPDGGRLLGVEQPQTLAELAELVTTIIFTASAQHAAVNFSQYDAMGYLPNLPGAQYGPPPTMQTPDTEAAYLEILPPLRRALIQFDIAYQLSHVRDNPLGDYPWLHFRDRRVIPLLKRFEDRLEVIENDTRERDRGRFLKYPYLYPSNITASIHI